MKTRGQDRLVTFEVFSQENRMGEGERQETLPTPNPVQVFKKIQVERRSLLS